MNIQVRRGWSRKVLKVGRGLAKTPQAIPKNPGAVAAMGVVVVSVILILQ
jgi:hypothetical protein